MKIKTGISIHNRFDFVITDVSTGKVDRAYANLEPQAENIVLDRIYTRLCNFQSYFDQIVFGTGTGTPTTSRTTLFNRVGNKAAVTDELVRAFPTSKWVRKTTLGTDEFNGNVLTEVGISDTTTNINTHAMITDAEGNPLTIEKTSLRIIDIYATVFITLYDVDMGLGWFDNGLRDYLTGGSAPNNNMGISFSGFPITNVTGTRTYDVSGKTITNSVRFNVQHHNKEVAYIDWTGVGLRCKIPRIGVWEGMQKNNVNLGVGDGVKTRFLLPQQVIDDLEVFVDDIVNEDWERDMSTNEIVFDSSPVISSIITANYFCNLIPKDENHVLDATMQIQFGANQPSPVMPPSVFPEKYNNLPGEKVVLGGDNDWYGFFGEVSAGDLISGNDLCTQIGLTSGTSQFSDAGWLKYLHAGKLLYVAKKTIRHTVSWDNINAVGSVFGQTQINIGGVNYKVRLLSSDEWDALIQPVHKDGISPRWFNYTDSDIQVNSGNGRATWTSTLSGTSRVTRGNGSVSSSSSDTPSSTLASHGFRPVLEVLV